MIGIIDYGAGNLASVQNALGHLGHCSLVCSDPNSLSEVERVILPGVGSFAFAMDSLETRNWQQHICEFVATGKPLLGICLGMQLLFDRGDEQGPRSGIGLIPGSVVKLAPSGGLNIPHMGWNDIKFTSEHFLLSGLKSNVDVYFVHSYHCLPEDQSSILATSNYGGDIVVAVAKDNVAGVQFHPEKSQPSGLRLLQNFVNWSV